jgi:hypothetical protein
MLYLFVIRFAVMTALGCGAVYGIRHWIGDAVREDPVLVSSYTRGWLGSATTDDSLAGLYSHPDTCRTSGTDSCCRECRRQATETVANADPVALFKIVEMSDAGEETQSAVAKTILISYVLTPLISLSVSAALTTVKLLY